MVYIKTISFSMSKLHDLHDLFGLFSKKHIRSRNSYDQDDLNYLIRQINLDVMIGSVDLSPNTKNLDEETIKKCKELSDMGMFIGGSVLLKACGLIERKCNDIDVFWDVKKAKEDGIITAKNIINSSKDYINPDVIRFKIDMPKFGVIDIFQYDKAELEIFCDGIRWGNPVYTMERKFEYHREKDNKDFWKIKAKLGY